MSSMLETMEQRVFGLRVRLNELREHERLFQRASGLKTQAEKDRAAVLELQESLKAETERLDSLRSAKAQAVHATAQAIAQKMGQTLPFGRAVFEIDDDGKAFLGWDIPDHGIVAYGGLSGGQRVMFETALAYALVQESQQNPVIIMEGAELGAEIDILLNSIAAANPKTQILACTCHAVPTAPDGWKMVHVQDSPQHPELSHQTQETI